MTLQTIHSMSGGEKARLALSILVNKRPNLLILDEPTNHLDLQIRESLTIALQSFAGAVLLVSHDRHLLESTCDEFYLLNDGVLAPFPGDLEDYHRYCVNKQKNQAASNTANEAGKINKKQQRRSAAEQRKKLQPLKKQLETLEATMEKLNQKNAELEIQLASPDIYSDSQKAQLKALLMEKSTIDQQLQEAEEKWLELSEALENH